MEVKYSEDLKHAYFNGIEFYKKDKYYANHTHDRLHRYIWEYTNGEIPNNYDIHHKDFNQFNNDISNLQLILKSEHNKLHALSNNLGKYVRTEEHIDNLRKIGKAIFSNIQNRKKKKFR